MLVEFCLPIKNEESILRSSLEKLLAFCRQVGFSFEWRIIGVVNGSTDRSADICREFSRRFPGQVGCFELSASGRGRALREYWQSSRADICAYMDVDLAVDLKFLAPLIEPLARNEADLAIGSRLLASSRTERSGWREVISQGYNLFIRLLLGQKVSDLQCGFKAIRRPVFEAIRPYFIAPHRFYDYNWFFDTELVVLSERLGYRIKEVAVDWQENRFQGRPTKVKFFRDIRLFMINAWIFRRHLKRIKKQNAV